MTKINDALIPANQQFFVGGLPRGGTTAFARALHLTPGIFCYAPESHILPFLFECAEIGPIPKLKRPLFRQLFKKQCKDVLIDMMAYSIARGASPKWQIFDEKKISQLTDYIMELVGKDYYGANFLSEAMAYFFSLTEQDKSVHLYGEKTPPNTFVHGHYKDEFPSKFFHVMREPFASCLSSHKRATNPDDKYAGIFSETLIENVGLYLHYMHAMARLRDSKNAFLVRYEDLMKDKETIIPQALSFLEPNKTSIYDEKNYRFLRPQENEITMGDIDKAEIAQIYLFTKRACRRAGYNNEFLNNVVGFDLKKEAAKIETPIETVFKLYGVRQSSADTLAVDRHFCFALPIQRRQKEIILRIKMNIPAAIPIRRQRLTLFVNDTPVLRFSEMNRNIDYEFKLNSENIPEDALKTGFCQIRGESNCGFRDIQLGPVGLDRQEHGLTIMSQDFS